MKILVSYTGKGKHLTFKNMPTNLMLEDYFRTQKNRKKVKQNRLELNKRILLCAKRSSRT